MKNLKSLKEYIKENFFYDKSKLYKVHIDLSQQVFHEIHNNVYRLLGLEPISKLQLDSWIRYGNLLPKENRNDEIITDYDGMSLSYDIVKGQFEFQIPRKFASDFWNAAESYIKTNHTLIKSKDTKYTKTILFKHNSSYL